MVFTGGALFFTHGAAVLPATVGNWVYVYRAGLVLVISGYYALNWRRSGQTLGMRAWRLRTVSELYPEIVDADAGEDPLPSCSAVEALDRQEPFINQTLALNALAMLGQLFRYGKLSYHGAFFNARTGQTNALPVDPTLWARTRRRSRKIAA